ncbi:hypothetical protein ACHWQZ_G013506 [Mnemiopsis leidyi]
MDNETHEEALKISKVRREEEWQKVRNPDVITEKDKEEDFETKTLYERLQENRELKRLEIEEQFRYKNMVYSGLDNDEHKFLEAWENSKKKEMSERTKMEIEELQKFKARIVDLDAKTDLSAKLTPSVPTNTTAVSRQKQLLSGAVKRRKVVKEPRKEPEPTPVSLSGLTGIGAYSDSGSESDSNKKDAKKESGSSSSSSDSSSSDSDSSSSSSSNGSGSSGSGSKRRKKKRKPSWESGQQQKNNDKIGNDSD